MGQSTYLVINVILLGGSIHTGIVHTATTGANIGAATSTASLTLRSSTMSNGLALGRGSTVRLVRRRLRALRLVADSSLLGDDFLGSGLLALGLGGSLAWCSAVLSIGVVQIRYLIFGLLLDLGLLLESLALLDECRGLARVQWGDLIDWFIATVSVAVALAGTSFGVDGRRFRSDKTTSDRRWDRDAFLLHTTAEFRQVLNTRTARELGAHEFGDLVPCRRLAGVASEIRLEGFTWNPNTSVGTTVLHAKKKLLILVI
jgi:hypothetical protein